MKKGQILNGSYKIISQLGSGGGGTVYKAWHIRLDKPVALKLIKSDIQNNMTDRAEADVLKNLKHEYLPQVIDFANDGDDVYTVMEFIQGNDFKQLVSEGRLFSEDEVRKYGLQLCEAVGYLHKHMPPIIHSDIKPANVMLTHQDDIRLIDFNISTVLTKRKAVSKGGSRDFGAPEQFRKIIDIPEKNDEFHEQTRFITDTDETEILDDNDNAINCVKTCDKREKVLHAYVDTRTDIFGIGATLAYMLTGVVPYVGNDDYFHNVKVSNAMKEIIIKCMQNDPSKRYKNVYELKKALKLSKISKSVTIASTAAVIIAVAVVGGIFVPSLTQNESQTLTILESDTTSVLSEITTTSTETKAVKSEWEETSSAIIETTIAPKDATVLTQAETYGVVSFFDNGNVQCEKTRPDQYGNYQLIWYEYNGKDDIREYYDKNDKIYMADINISGEWHSGEVIKNTNGYGILIKYTDRSDCAYIRYDLNEARVTKQITKLDKNMNEIELLLVEEKYYNDGSSSVTWYKTNGDIHQVQYHYVDKSKKIVFYKNGHAYMEKEVDADGNESVKKIESNAPVESTAAVTENAQVIPVIETPVKNDTIKICGKEYPKNLTEINLSGMNLTDGDIKPLAQMTELKVLWLNDNHIRDLSPLKNLTKLTELHLGHNNISDISDICNLTNLEMLGLKYNNLVNIEGIENLTKLKSLSLNNNKITIIEAVGKITQIERLWIHDNYIADISALKSCTSLIQLDFGNNPIEDISAIANMNNMHYLYMRNTDVSSLKSISDMKNLIVIDISNTKVSDISLLKNFTQLETLGIYGTDISSSKLSELQKQLPNCCIYSDENYFDIIYEGLDY